MKAREFWIGIDENESPRWISGDERFAPLTMAGEAPFKEKIRVREIRGYDHVLTGAQLERLLREVATGEKSDTDAMLEVLKNELQG
jgi:hypothetical protein